MPSAKLTSATMHALTSSLGRNAVLYPSHLSRLYRLLLPLLGAPGGEATDHLGTYLETHLTRQVSGSKALSDIMYSALQEPLFFVPSVRLYCLNVSQ